MSAGVVPTPDCLKKLIKICFPANVRNQPQDAKKFGAAEPSLEIKELNDSNIFLKIAQYERAHFYIYDMSFYSGTAAADKRRRRTIDNFSKNVSLPMENYSSFFGSFRPYVYRTFSRTLR